MMGSYHRFMMEQARCRARRRARCQIRPTECTLKAKADAILEGPADGHSLDGHPYTIAMTGDGKPQLLFAEHDAPEGENLVVMHVEPPEPGELREPRERGVMYHQFTRDPDGPRHGRVVYYYRA